MRRLAALAGGLLVLLLTGCASVPMATVGQDTQAKNFTPPPGLASLYVYRNETIGAALPITLSINGTELAQTAARTYLRLDLRPGSYKLDSYAENVSSLNVVAEAADRLLASGASEILDALRSSGADTHHT